MKYVKKKTALLACTVLLAGSAWVNTASALTLGLALVLDSSGSISDTSPTPTSEWDLQLDGYKNVFSSGTFYDNFIAPSIYDILQVSAYSFGSTVSQEIGWTSISSNADATAFGNQFDSTFRKDDGLTNTEQAILDATTGLNGISADKLVIDISTDGNPTASAASCSNNTCREAAAITAADAARDDSITINALGVGNGINTTFLNALVGISPADTPTGFFLQADNFSEFASTLETKLERETGVPEPSVLLLIGSGFIGLALARRRKAG